MFNSKKRITRLETKVENLEKEVKKLRNSNKIEMLVEKKKSLKKEKKNLKKENYYRLAENGTHDEKEKIASCRSTFIYCEIAAFVVFFSIIVVIIAHCYLCPPYQTAFIGLITLSITFCLEPYFKMRTDRFSQNYFREYLQFKLNTLKLGWFILLSIILTVIFTILPGLN